MTCIECLAVTGPALQRMEAVRDIKVSEWLTAREVETDTDTEDDPPGPVEARLRKKVKEIAKLKRKMSPLLLKEKTNQIVFKCLFFCFKSSCRDQDIRTLARMFQCRAAIKLRAMTNGTCHVP